MHVIEATRKHLFGKGDEVWRFAQVPLFMGPEGTCLTNTSLNLINDEVNAKLLSNVLEALCEFGGYLIVTTIAHNRLNNYADDLRALF